MGEGVDGGITRISGDIYHSPPPLNDTHGIIKKNHADYIVQLKRRRAKHEKHEILLNILSVNI